MTKNKNPVGRPVIYNFQIFDDICARIAEGESLNKITKEDKYPVKITFYRWLRQNEDLCTQYATAKKDRADTYADEMVDIADDVDKDKEAIQKAKLRIDARKWIACKLHPRNYGERTMVDANIREVQDVDVPDRLSQEDWIKNLG